MKDAEIHIWISGPPFHVPPSQMPHSPEGLAFGHFSEMTALHPVLRLCQVLRLELMFSWKHTSPLTTASASLPLGDLFPSAVTVQARRHPTGFPGDWVDLGRREGAAARMQGCKTFILSPLSPLGPRAGLRDEPVFCQRPGPRWMWNLVGWCRQHLVRFIFPLLREKNVVAVPSICSAAKWQTGQLHGEEPGAEPSSAGFPQGLGG